MVQIFKKKKTAQLSQNIDLLYPSQLSLYYFVTCNFWYIESLNLIHNIF